MTIQLTYPAVDRFDPDPAIQEWLKDKKRKRIPGFMDRESKFRQVNYQWLVMNLWRDNEECKSAEILGNWI